jgi:hypothetical protein
MICFKNNSEIVISLALYLTLTYGPQTEFKDNYINNLKFIQLIAKRPC